MSQVLLKSKLEYSIGGMLDTGSSQSSQGSTSAPHGQSHSLTNSHINTHPDTLLPPTSSAGSFSFRSNSFGETDHQQLPKLSQVLSKIQLEQKLPLPSPSQAFPSSQRYALGSQMGYTSSAYSPQPLIPSLAYTGSSVPSFRNLYPSTSVQEFPVRSTSPTLSLTGSSPGSSAQEVPEMGRARATNPRRYKCKICSRSFTTSGHLARHNRIHTGVKNHVCPFHGCNARFSRQDNCMQHYKTHLNGKRSRRRSKHSSVSSADL